MTIIEINKRQKLIPEKWNELTQAQLLQIMDALFVKQYTSEECLAKLFKIICDMTWREFFLTKMAEVEEFLYLTSFILEQRADLTKQLIPCYNGFYGPEESFGNLKMKELVMTEHYYEQWYADRENFSLLNELCAILYRPAKHDFDFLKYPNGEQRPDPRIEYDQYLSNHFAKNRIVKWPIKVRLAIATWYESCKVEMIENNSEVFGGEGGEPAKYGLISVIRRVAKDGALGTLDQVQEQFVNLVMIDLNESVAEGKAMEKAMKVK